MGGTFNPVHLGHLIMAESVMYSLQADGMLFIPVRHHPLKSDTTLTGTYEHRLAMLQLALVSNPRFAIEETPEDLVFTIDLIDLLRHKYPSARFFLPLGSDIVAEFHQWHKYNEIEENIAVVVASRPGHQLCKRDDGVLRSAECVMIPQYDISSSDIRSRMRTKRSIKYMVPETVETYIKAHDLYAAHE